MEEPLDTVVIGAGISGLAFAHERRRVAPGERLSVLEAGPRAGGLVRTRTQDGFRFEEGPEALPSHAKGVRELCQELGVALQEAPREASKRFLLLDGKLQEVPASPDDLATSRILSFGAKLRLMAEASCARDEALAGSIAAFARHRFGKEALERVVDPLVAGIHAGDPEQLSLRACFPEVVRMVEEHGSVTAALKARAARKKADGASASLGGGLMRPAGGMESLVSTLAGALEGVVRTSTKVTALLREPDRYVVRTHPGAPLSARRVVLAVPLAAARELLSGPAPDAAAVLSTMPSEGLVSVVHAYRRGDVTHPLDGFGYLTPKSAGGFVLGTLFSSSLAPDSAPAGHVLLRSLLGGARRPEAASLDESTLEGHAVRECAAALGITRPPAFVRVARHPEVIPRFDLEHLARRARLAELLPDDLVLLGNFTQGLGLESLVSAARAAAREL
jgi:oxygen-dependent protoporphyrinogen oxidase